MAERSKGITFSTESCRAIRLRIKTQTRRVIDPQPAMPANGGTAILPRELPGGRWGFQQLKGRKISTFASRYRPDEVLWVKQPYRVFRAAGPGEEHRQQRLELLIDYGEGEKDYEWKGCKDQKTYLRLAHTATWQNPMFMGFWAHRQAIKVRYCFAAQLGQMSEQDYCDEGVLPRYEEAVKALGEKALEGRDAAVWNTSTSKENFAWFWNRINEKRGVPFRPDLWVWAIGFSPFIAAR